MPKWCKLLLFIVLFLKIALESLINPKHLPMPASTHGYSEVLLTQLRRELHKYPELSGEEVQTSIRISRFVSDQKPDRIINGLGGHGVAAVFEGKNPGKRIMLRCELDALPIEESNQFTYRSVKKGVSHVCGHDGHMAILCGVASLLGIRRPEYGSVVLLFQPAEENGAGAVNILNDKRFKEIWPDYIIALHNLPGYRKGTVVVRENTFTASVNSIIIKLQGVKAHAGEPMRGNNPANAVAEIIGTLRRAENRRADQPDFALFTPVYIRLGSIAYGISADDAELHYTLRASNETHLRKLEAFTVEQVQKVASDCGLELTLDWTQRFIATENDPGLTRVVSSAAKAAGLEVSEAENPFSWGEDFGYFTKEIPGVLFGLGAGTRVASLHQPDYDFPDVLLGAGADLFREIINLLLE